MKSLLTILALGLVITACNQSPAPADSSVITSRSKAWETALNAQDIDALVALYTRDARVLPPNHKTVTGSAAVRAEFGAMIDAGVSAKLTSVEAMVSGNIGYHVGTFSLTVDGETADTGKFIETWRRGDDGQWRISNDIYNSDMPVAAAENLTTHLMISHEVENGERWMNAWRGADNRHKLFMAHGATNVLTFQSPDNPNLTGLVINVSDMDALEEMLNSEAGMAAAAADGVKRDTMHILVQVE